MEDREIGKIMWFELYDERYYICLGNSIENVRLKLINSMGSIYFLLIENIILQWKVNS